MNWDSFLTAGGIVSAIALVVALVYMLRHTSRVTGSKARDSLTVASRNVFEKLEENAADWVKLNTGEQSVSPEQDARLSEFVVAVLGGFESQCHAHEAGLLDKSEWQASRKTVLDLCALPGFRRYYVQQRSQISDQLRLIIDALGGGPGPQESA